MKKVSKLFKNFQKFSKLFKTFQKISKISKMKKVKKHENHVCKKWKKYVATFHFFWKTCFVQLFHVCPDRPLHATFSFYKGRRRELLPNFHEWTDRESSWIRMIKTRSRNALLQLLKTHFHVANTRITWSTPPSATLFFNFFQTVQQLFTSSVLIASYW